MKKYAVRLLVAAAVLLCLCTAARAGLAEDARDAVPESARELLGDASVGDEGLFDKIGAAAGDMFFGSLRSAAGTGAAVLTAAAVCALLSAAFPGEETPQYVDTAGALAIAAVSLGSLTSFTGLAKETLGDLSVFSASLLPCLASAAAFAGETASGAARYAASSFFMSVLLTLSERLIMPLVGAFIAAAVADAAVGGGMLRGAAGVMKWVSTLALTAVTAAFAVTINVTGAVAASTDAAAIRAVKTAMSASLPVAGSIIADAAGSVLGGAAALKAAIGAFGLAAAAACCVGPVLKLAAYLLVYKAAAALAGPIAGPRLSGLLGDLGTAFGLLLGLVGSACVVLFIAVTAAMKTVVW
ncbi:MAG: hypothetical protein IK136_02315 [Oscillospiraceae bacterium]|nr:hypothetical protein [Oscillospiraceae bacterium]